MIKQGFLAATQKETILVVLEAGNACAHRAFTPEKELLTKALGITETLLEHL